MGDEYERDQRREPMDDTWRYFSQPSRYDSVTGEVWRRVSGEWKLVALLPVGDRREDH